VTSSTSTAAAEAASHQTTDVSPSLTNQSAASRLTVDDSSSTMVATLLTTDASSSLPSRSAATAVGEVGTTAAGVNDESGVGLAATSATVAAPAATFAAGWLDGNELASLVLSETAAAGATHPSPSPMTNSTLDSHLDSARGARRLPPEPPAKKTAAAAVAARRFILNDDIKIDLDNATWLGIGFRV